MSPQKNRVFNSVKEAWNGVLSGSVVLTKTRKSRPVRRSSCSIIDTKPSSLGLNSPSTKTATTSKDQEDDDYTPAECTVFVRLPDEDEQTQKEVDISSLSNEEVERLKVTDPFLFYSIPSIRKRDGFNVDAGPRSSTRRSSLPAKMLANAEMNNQQNQQMKEEDRPVRRGSIVRKNRLSTEAHPALICEALLKDMQALDNIAALHDDDNSIASMGGSLFDEDDIDLLGKELDGVSSLKDLLESE